MMISWAEIRVASILLVCAYLNTQCALAQPQPVQQNVVNKLTRRDFERIRIQTPEVMPASNYTLLCDTYGSGYASTIEFVKNGETICIVKRTRDTWSAVTNWLRRKCATVGYHNRFVFLDDKHMDTSKMICRRSDDGAQLPLYSQQVNTRPLESDGSRVVISDTDGSQYPQRFTFYKVDNNGNTHICQVDHQLDNCITRIYPLLHGSTYMCGCLNNTRFIYMNITDGTDKVICKRQSDDKQLPVYYGPDDVQLVAHRSVDFGIRYYMGSSKLEAIEGENVLVTCRGNCNPACSVNLYRGAVEDDRLLSTDGNYNFGNINRDLDGTRIFCKVERHDGSAYPVIKEMKVTIAYGPKFMKLNTEKITKVNEGKDVSVSCTSDCNPPCNFKWYDMTRGPRYNTRLTSGGTLTFLNINTNVTGKYVCRTRNAVSQNSTKMLMIVNYAPRVSVKSGATNNIVSEDSSVTLTCSVDSSPSSSISWSRSQQGYLSSEASLFIPVASCAHTDNYTCTVNNGIGSSVSRTISLNIKCLPRIDTEKNKDTKLDSRSARIGETSELSIFLMPGPPPRFTWYRQHPNGLEKRVTDFWTKQNDTEFSSTLAIENITAIDFGYYKVYVQNWYGVRSRLFEIIPAPSNTDIEN